MIFNETELEGAFLLAPERHLDERGYFVRTFCRGELEHHGLNPDVAQSNLSFNRFRGTLRGLHFQRQPYAEDRLVGCVAGSIFDVIVDLRPGSSTRSRWIGFELSADNGWQVYVPRGFAHGFLSLEDNTLVSYQMSEFYAPDHGAGYRYDDPSFDIEWPAAVEVVSERDLALPLWQESDEL